jgi:hypothetical protein
MGGKFTASEEALRPVLREVAKRGLSYVDDGGSARSLAAQIAGSQNLPFAKTDVALDTSPSPPEIDRADAAGNGGARQRYRGRLRQRPAGGDCAHRGLGEDGGEPRLCRRPDQHGGGEGEVVIVIPATFS